jgi:hypothetical protein
LLIVRLAFRNPLDPRDPRLDQTGDNLGLVDRIDRQQELVVVYLHHDILLFYTAQEGPEKCVAFEAGIAA